MLLDKDSAPPMTRCPTQPIQCRECFPAQFTPPRRAPLPLDPFLVLPFKLFSGPESLFAIDGKLLRRHRVAWIVTVSRVTHDGSSSPRFAPFGSFEIFIR